MLESLRVGVYQLPDAFFRLCMCGEVVHLLSSALGFLTETVTKTSHLQVSKSSSLNVNLPPKYSTSAHPSQTLTCCLRGIPLPRREGSLSSTLKYRHT